VTLYQFLSTLNKPKFQSQLGMASSVVCMLEDMYVVLHHTYHIILP